MPMKVLRSAVVIVAVSVLFASTTFAQRVPEAIYKEGYEAVKNLFSQAVVAGDLEICKELLEKNAYYINEADRNGFTQLHHAAMSGQTDMCRLFIQHGANATIARKGGTGTYYTPLEAAIANDHTATALVLIDTITPESLAPIRGQNAPPLFLAIQNENVEIIKALIAKKADVNSPSKSGAGLFTPFAYAISIANQEIAKILLDAGADLQFEQGDVRTADALFTAVLCRYYDISSFLVESKMDLNVKDSQGQTILHTLLNSETISFSFEDVNNLPLDLDKDLRQPFAVTGPYKWAVDPDISHVSVAERNFRNFEHNRPVPDVKVNRLFKLFVEAGTDVNIRDKNDCSVLETLLLSQIGSEQRAYVNTESLVGAREFEDFQEILELLITAKVDMNAADKNGWTPLYYLLFYCFLDHPLFEEALDETKIKAIADRKIALFNIFIEAGAQVKTADKKGNTLLHYVVQCPGGTIDKGRFDIDLLYDARGFHRLFSRQLIELLLEHGLTLSDENNDGETPLDWATGASTASRGGMGMGGMGGMGGGNFGGGGMGGGNWGGGMGGMGGMISPPPPVPPMFIPAAPGASPASQLGF